jgi:spore germination protein GerM
MNNRILITTIVLLILLAGGYFLFRNGGTVEPINTGNNNATTTEDTDNNEAVSVSTIKIALLDPSKERAGKERGCDNVIMVAREVSPTQAPLTAALKELFSITDNQVGGLYNFIPKTRSTLLFDRAEVQNGTAKVYLTGSLSGLSGVCDDPRAKIQIEETALQFPTVQRVEIYLNGVRNELMPSER